MKRARWFSNISMVLVAVGAGTLSQAATSCIQVSAKAPDTVCVGQPVSVQASLTSTCMSTEQVWIAGALDGQTLPGVASRSVPAGATIVASVVGIVPAKLAPGDHILTITATDSSGSAATTEGPVTAQSCTSARVSRVPRAAHARAFGR